VRRVCLFAQYDPEGRLRPHVLHYLQALVQAGYEVRLACSGAGRVDPAAAPVLDRLGVIATTRPNGGHDFGAWRHLMQGGAAQGADRVLLANDSVFGPMADLRPIVEQRSTAGLDAWGMVESREHGRHLQSWFIEFTAEALARPAVRRVFEQPFEEMGKREIVARGELALGAAMRAEGLAFAGVAAARGGVNPMHYGWKTLLRAGVPFLKAELVRDNPWRIGWASDWRREVARRGYDPALVDEALGAAPGLWRTPTPRTPVSERFHQLRVAADRVDALRSLLAPPR
jgi:lipopolysaccharide biosynthesis protein